MRHKNDLGKDSVRALVFRLAIPTMIAQFVNVLYSIVDRIYIGNIASLEIRRLLEPAYAVPLSRSYLPLGLWWGWAVQSLLP